MKDWKSLSNMLQLHTPLVSELLLSQGGDAIAALLAKHLDESLVVFEQILADSDDCQKISSVIEFENLHRNKLEAMVFTKASVSVSQVPSTVTHNVNNFNGASILVGVVVGAVITAVCAAVIYVPIS